MTESIPAIPDWLKNEIDQHVEEEGFDPYMMGEYYSIAEKIIECLRERQWLKEGLAQ